MGADEQMIIDAVKAEVDEQLAHAGIPAEVSAAEAGGFAITLTKAGTSETRVMDFDIQEKDTLTVATYNIYGWGYPDMGMINDKLMQADADIAGLQECNHEVNGGGQDEASAQMEHTPIPHSRKDMAMTRSGAEAPSYPSTR